MAIIQTYATEIEIAGYYYDANVKYVKEKDGSIEIKGIKLFNDSGEDVEFPYLNRVEQDILEEIEESYR